MFKVFYLLLEIFPFMVLAATSYSYSYGIWYGLVSRARRILRMSKREEGENTCFPFSLFGARNICLAREARYSYGTSHS